MEWLDEKREYEAALTQVRVTAKANKATAEVRRTVTLTFEAHLGPDALEPLGIEVAAAARSETVREIGLAGERLCVLTIGEGRFTATVAPRYLSADPEGGPFVLTIEATLGMYPSVWAFAGDAVGTGALRIAQEPWQKDLPGIDLGPEDDQTAPAFDANGRAVARLTEIPVPPGVETVTIEGAGKKVTLTAEQFAKAAAKLSGKRLKVEAKK